ncbi:MAG: methyltransferase domain-containing protein [Candidatus Daviesbacteria bacterium]|nr:methyltransferase domain-containing protein [Candidatus Daviesbacteria bacterium]
MVKEVESFYDKVAVNYSNHDDRVCDRIVEHFIIDNLQKNKILKILDAGGGTGRFSEPLLKKGHKIVLTDLSKEMLNKAKSKLRSSSNMGFVKNSVTDMAEFENDSFDVVLMINAILDYCGDYDKAMQEAHRVLKKGGLLMATANNRLIYCKSHELKEGDYESFRKNMKTGDRYIVWGGQEKGHISHEFTLDELRNSLTQNGFKIKKLLGIFNLMDKYEMNNLENKEEFIKIQIEYAELQEYINNSQDFFFVGEK